MPLQDTTTQGRNRCSNNHIFYLLNKMLRCVRMILLVEFSKIISEIF